MRPGLSVRVATAADLGWVASAHDAVGFPRSTDDDLVLVAWLDGHRVGTGRLVPRGDDRELGGMYVAPERRRGGVAGALVSGLLRAAGRRVTWCLPLAPLAAWYQRFGLAPADGDDAPADVRDKLAWCRATFPEGVALLVRRPQARCDTLDVLEAATLRGAPVRLALTDGSTRVGRPLDVVTTAGVDAVVLAGAEPLALDDVIAAHA